MTQMDDLKGPLPEAIHPGALADPAPWNASGGPYRLPRPTRILEVSTGNFSGGIGVLVDCGPRYGRRWLTAQWFLWRDLVLL